MTTPIDPLRRAARLRRAVRPDSEEPVEAAAATELPGLPVPVEPARSLPPRAGPAPGGAVFDAQLIGQDGQKRGLRAGPQAIDLAKASYNKIEWSGAKDRRARKGRYKTEI